MPNWFTAPLGSLPLACCSPKSLQDWDPLTSLLKSPPIKWHLSLHPPFIFYPKKDCTHPLFSILRKLCYFPIAGVDARADDPTSPPPPSLQRKKRSQRSEWPPAPTSAFSSSLCSRTWVSAVTAITWHADISCCHSWHRSTSPGNTAPGRQPHERWEGCWSELHFPCYFCMIPGRWKFSYLLSPRAGGMGAQGLEVRGWREREALALSNSLWGNSRLEVWV